MINSNIFSKYAMQYLDHGLYPVPIKKRQKSPAKKNWCEKVPDLPAREEIEHDIASHGSCGIGVATGTTLPNSNFFGAIDIDVQGFRGFVTQMLGEVKSERLGKKGSMIYVQFVPGLKSTKLKSKGKTNYAVELMMDTGMTVIPPTIHPDGMEYKWDDKGLLDINLAELPVLTEEKYNIIQLVARNEHAWKIVEDGADVQGHEPMLQLAASGVANLTEDLEWLAGCLNALFHQNYKGNTREETLGMLQSARDKGLGKNQPNECYDPGVEGPLPLGYLADGHYVFYDQMRHILIIESANRLISEGSLLNMADMDFWKRQFPRFYASGMPAGIDTKLAANSLISICRKRGGFDPSIVRGRGVYPASNNEIVVNWGGEAPENDGYTYVCHLALQKEIKASVEPSTILEFLKLFNWSNASEPYLLMGWAVMAVICGTLNWRPHMFLSGAKNTGKTTIQQALTALLDPMVVSLDGQSTEAGIRQKIGPDSRPVILDEFESDQDTRRMKQVIKLIRSASSAKNTIARGTPEGKALEFCISSSFLLCAINPFMVTAADRSRIVVLTLKQHDNNQQVHSQISEMRQLFNGVGPYWCQLVIENASLILQAIETLRLAFPPCDSRHAQNMSTLLAASWVILNRRELIPADAGTIVQDHLHAIVELAEAHEEDDAIECLNVLLSYRLADNSVGGYLAVIKHEKNRLGCELAGAEMELAKVGIKYEDGDIIIANSHPGLSKVYSGTIWESRAWATALQRLPGAEKMKQRRFSDGVRSLAMRIPSEYTPEPHEQPLAVPI